MKILWENVYKKSLVRGGRRALVDTDNLQPPAPPTTTSLVPLSDGAPPENSSCKVICET